jgi:hypothetical protein
VHTAAIAHALAIQIAESNSARPQSIENVNRSFTCDFSYPGVLLYAQLCGEATAATARDDAAQLSAERRLQVAHQLVGVDDAARGDTDVAVGTKDEHGRVRDIVVRAKSPSASRIRGSTVPATSASGAATR